MNQNRYYTPVFAIYFLGILFGILLCWQLPDSCRTSLSIYRLVAEELFLQGEVKQMLFQCFIRRFFLLLVLFLAYFSNSSLLRYLTAGYLGVILSVSISVLTTFYRTLGILYCAAIFLPQGIFYGWVCCSLLLSGDRSIYLPRIQFLRCGIFAMSWMIGIILEAILQPYLLRIISFI